MTTRWLHFYHCLGCLMIVSQLFGQTTNSNHPIFTSFPWVTNLVDDATCSTESIEVYQTGVHRK